MSASADVPPCSRPLACASRAPGFEDSDNPADSRKPPSSTPPESATPARYKEQDQSAQASVPARSQSPASVESPPSRAYSHWLQPSAVAAETAPAPAAHPDWPPSQPHAWHEPGPIEPYPHPSAPSSCPPRSA